jgi:hypothetical protein
MAANRSVILARILPTSGILLRPRCFTIADVPA